MKMNDDVLMMTRRLFSYEWPSKSARRCVDFSTPLTHNRGDCRTVGFLRPTCRADAASSKCNTTCAPAIVPSLDAQRCFADRTTGAPRSMRNLTPLHPRALRAPAVAPSLDAPQCHAALLPLRCRTRGTRASAVVPLPMRNVALLSASPLRRARA